MTALAIKESPCPSVKLRFGGKSGSIVPAQVIIKLLLFWLTEPFLFSFVGRRVGLAFLFFFIDLSPVFSSFLCELW